MKNRTTPQSGFTLIEILAVVAIIIIVAGLVLGISGVVTVKMDTAKAQKELVQIARHLDMYRDAFGTYPDESKRSDNELDKNELAILANWIRTAHPDDRTSYSNLPTDVGTPIRDPWGTPYKYFRQSQFSYRLVSFGPDGKPGIANKSPVSKDSWGLGDDVSPN